MRGCGLCRPYLFSSFPGREDHPPTSHSGVREPKGLPGGSALEMTGSVDMVFPHLGAGKTGESV